MNILIVTDLEGISGIDSAQQIQCDAESPMYQDSCAKLMNDINNTVEGALDAGAKKVFVWDGHGKGVNFLKDKLHKHAVQTGMDTVDYSNIDGFIQVGAHAMAGTLNAFLDHTQSSVQYYNYYIENIRCGEIAKVGAFAGYYDIPVVMISGDDATVREAQRFFPYTVTAEVKRAVSRNEAVSLNPDAAAELLHKAAYEGMKKLSTIPPLKFQFPLKLSLEFTRSDFADYYIRHQKHQSIRLDARTVTKTLHKIEKYNDLIFI